MFSNRNIGQVCIYTLLYSFVSLFLHHLPVRISLSFHDFLKVSIHHRNVQKREDLGISISAVGVFCFLNIFQSKMNGQMQSKLDK